MSGLSQLSLAARRAMFSPQTDKVILPLIKIWGPSIPTPFRLVRNNADLVSTADGTSQTYTKFAFNILLPDDTSDVTMTSQLEADGVDQTLVAAFRPLTDEAFVTLWIVLADSPNVIEAGPETFKFGQVQNDLQRMVVNLRYEDRLENALEGVTFDPINAPGIH